MVHMEVQPSLGNLPKKKRKLLAAKPGGLRAILGNHITEGTAILTAVLDSLSSICTRKHISSQ